MTTQPQFYETISLSQGSETLTVWASAGTNLETYDFTINYNGGQVAINGSNQPEVTAANLLDSNWLVQSNTTLTLGLVKVGGFDSTSSSSDPAAVTSDQAIASVTFALANGVTSITQTGTVTDWSNLTGESLTPIVLAPLCLWPEHL